MGEKLGDGLALTAGERGQAGEEVVIAEGGGGGKDVRPHVLCVSRPF